MSGLEIREMRAADLPEVARVDQEAFSLAAVRTGRSALETPRHSAGIEYFRGMAPDLCLVAEHEGRIAGYTLGHRWGATTWIGPVGVAPDLMGKGIGTELLAAFRDRSLAGGATTIGLETSILDNVRLYEKRGYKAMGLRLLLEKPVGANPGTTADTAYAKDGGTRINVVPLAELEPGERHRLAAESRKLAGLVEPGLDHSEELSAVYESGMGQTLVALDGDGRLAGYATMYLKELRGPEMDIRKAKADALVWIMTGWPAACAVLTRECERTAAAAGAARLKVPCYAGNPHGFALLKALGYVPEAAFVRMFLAGQVRGSAGQAWQTVPLDFSSWLG